MTQVEELFGGFRSIWVSPEAVLGESGYSGQSVRQSRTVCPEPPDPESQISGLNFGTFVKECKLSFSAAFSAGFSAAFSRVIA